jgi:hypothetical protein
MVFTRPIYLAITTGVAVGFWVMFNVLDELLFFSPIFVFYLPGDAVTSFILSNITALLLGVVVAMNVYVFRNSKVKLSNKCHTKHLCELLVTWILPCVNVWECRTFGLYNNV